MIFSYKWLKDYIRGRIPDAKTLGNIFTMHSFEVEEVKKEKQDWLLDIDVLPNRAPDCLSHIGIAREAVTVLNYLNNSNLSLIVPKGKAKENQKVKAEDVLEVVVENQNDCQRYSAKVFFGVKVGPSPKWIQEKLISCGLQPINNIVDITNYVMLETGQPLHAFDFDKLETIEKNKNPKKDKVALKKTVFVRRAKKREKLVTLDGKEYELTSNDLVIADSKKAICLAGIKGGENSGIDANTKNIVVEAANFNSQMIRKTSKRIKLKTDASWRFENGIDPNLIDFAQERVAFLIKKIAGGQVLKGLVDVYPKKVKEKKIILDLEYLNSLLGIKMPKKDVVKILRMLGFKVLSLKNSKNKKYISVMVPTRRLDVSIQEDLIEEVGRIYGIQNIPSVFPKEALIPPEKNYDEFWQRRCKDILKEMKFCETYNYSFLGEKEKDIFNYSNKEIVEVLNPMSSFVKYLRPSLIPNLLKNVHENLKYFNEIKIFELGKVFKPNSNPKAKDKFLEEKMLSAVFTRKRINKEGFYELKGIVDSLLNKLGITGVWYDDYGQKPEMSKISTWQPVRCAEIKVGDEKIGFLGEINPEILYQMGVNEKVFAFDLMFSKLSTLASEENEYEPISIHPAAVRDLSILVPQNVKVVDVLNMINSVGGSLVRDVDLFDMYSGEKIAFGKKNLAFHVIYQAADRTLTPKEIDEVQNKIIKALEEEQGWEVRKK